MFETYNKEPERSKKLRSTADMLKQFVLAGTLLFAAGLIYELVAGKMDNRAYKLAVGLAVGTAFVLAWTNMIRISESENLANAMYFGFIAAGFIVAFMVCFKPRGMAWILFGMAAAQMAITVILLTVGPLAASIMEIDIPDIFSRNAVFALLWLSSALLFRRAARN